MSNTATKIVLKVISTLTQGATESIENFRKRVARNTSELTIYTGQVKDKRGRLRDETVGERIYRAITELDNPTYEVKHVEGPLAFNPAN